MKLSFKGWSLNDISSGTKANQASQLKFAFGKDPVSSKPLNIANAIFILLKFVIFNFLSLTHFRLGSGHANSLTLIFLIIATSSQLASILIQKEACY